MTDAWNSRATGLDTLLHEVFEAAPLEAELPPEVADAGFPLRPFVSLVPQDDLISTEPVPDESPVDRLYRRAVEATRRDRTGEAIQRYRELLGLEPGHLEARTKLSLLLESSGDPVEALEQLSAALRVLPDEVNLLVSRGSIRGRLKQYGEAEGDLRRALRLAPDHVVAHTTLGLVLWRKGVPREAAVVLQRAIALEPGNAAAHHYLGEALNQAGDLPGARTALERAVELEPAGGRSCRLLARVLDRLGLYDEAQEMYRRAREQGGA